MPEKAIILQGGVETVDMKKIYPEDKNRKKKIMEFLDKKGFYVVLFLCIAIVGATALYVTNRGMSLNEFDYGLGESIEDQLGEEYFNEDEFGASSVSDEMEDEVLNASEDALADKTGSNAVNNTGSDVSSAEKAGIGNTETKSNEVKAAGKDAEANQKSASAAGDSEKTTSSVAVAAESKATTPKSTTPKDQINDGLAMPVTGKVTLEFATDKLVYSKTLEQWRAHEGLDIAAERGTPVRAAADGYVSAIKNDPRYGIVVVLNHDNNVQTVYANLASDEVVAVNQKVKKGDIIGSVGDTAKFETVDESHLHFEVLIDNKHVNPADYLPIK